MVRNIRRVLISDPVDPICAQILQQQGLEVTSARQWSKEKLLEEIQVCALNTYVSIYIIITIHNAAL